MGYRWDLGGVSGDLGASGSALGGLWVGPSGWDIGGIWVGSGWGIGGVSVGSKVVCVCWLLLFGSSSPAYSYGLALTACLPLPSAAHSTPRGHVRLDAVPSRDLGT